MPTAAASESRPAAARFFGRRQRIRGAEVAAEGARRRRLLSVMAESLGIAVDEMDSGWEGLQPTGGVSAAASGAGGAAGPVSPTLAVGSDRNGKGFVLHAANSMVVVHVLDAASGLPVATHAPRCGHGGQVQCCSCSKHRHCWGASDTCGLETALPSPCCLRCPGVNPLCVRPRRLLSAFFDSEGLPVGPQSGYESPAAIFDKDAKRFALAAVSQAAPAAAGAPAAGAGPAPAGSVLWLGASLKSDPRQAWRMVALPAPAVGSPDNPCGSDQIAVWVAGGAGVVPALRARSGQPP
jgi:hypothetical protein